MDILNMTLSKNRERFVALAEKRVKRAIKDLQLIGNLSNKSNYSYTEQDVKKILNALNNELKILKRRFTNEKKIGEISFKL